MEDCNDQVFELMWPHVGDEYFFVSKINFISVLQHHKSDKLWDYLKGALKTVTHAGIKRAEIWEEFQGLIEPALYEERYFVKLMSTNRTKWVAIVQFTSHGKDDFCYITRGDGPHGFFVPKQKLVEPIPTPGQTVFSSGETDAPLILPSQYIHSDEEEEEQLQLDKLPDGSDPPGFHP